MASFARQRLRHCSHNMMVSVEMPGGGFSSGKHQRLRGSQEDCDMVDIMMEGWE